MCLRPTLLVTHIIFFLMIFYNYVGISNTKNSKQVISLYLTYAETLFHFPSSSMDREDVSFPCTMYLCFTLIPNGTQFHSYTNTSLSSTSVVPARDLASYRGLQVRQAAAQPRQHDFYMPPSLALVPAQVLPHASQLVPCLNLQLCREFLGFVSISASLLRRKVSNPI